MADLGQIEMWPTGTDGEDCTRYFPLVSFGSPMQGTFGARKIVSELSINRTVIESAISIALKEKIRSSGKSHQQGKGLPTGKRIRRITAWMCVCLVKFVHIVAQVNRLESMLILCTLVYAFGAGRRPIWAGYKNANYHRTTAGPSIQPSHGGWSVDRLPHISDAVS